MTDTQQVKVVLTHGPDGEELDRPVVLYVEAATSSGEQMVGSTTVDTLRGVLDGVQLLARSVADAVRAVRPDKFTVELGFEVKSEAGGLVALVTRAGGSASLKAVLEWDTTRPAAAAAGG